MTHLTTAPRPRSTQARLAVLTALLAVVAGLVVVGPAGAATPQGTGHRAAYTRSISVGGDGVGMYPAFSATTSRYAVTTGDTTAGTITVTATTSDPSGTVRIDGQPVTGPATLTGLADGAEVSVLIDDADGHAACSLIYLPAGFPTLKRTSSDDDLAALQPGYTLLTLGRFVVPGPYYETAVDANGVPVFAHRAAASSTDLKSAPGGHYSVNRMTTKPGRTGADVVELGPDFQPVASYDTAAPLTDTDGHDALLLPDGDRFLTAYQFDPDTNLTDAVVQETDSAGNVLFTWNSKDHMVRSPAQDTMLSAAALAANTSPKGDYAHMNSIRLADDGDLLISFRHLSSVWKVALTAHDGFAVGDVEWRLGGRDSDFTFDDPGDANYPSDGTDGGPCAQHTASMLPNGHLLVWDNGSSNQTGALCVDGTDPYAPAVARGQSRAVEFSLDTSTPGAFTASVVRSNFVPGRFTIFAGSASRLANDDTLVGWAAATESIASEFAPDGTILWNLADANPDVSVHQFTYRAAHAPVPDWAAPVVTVTAPAEGLVVDQDDVSPMTFACTDVGGSTLQACTGSRPEGSTLDTSKPGAHTVTVRATDGAGHSTVVTRHYTVLPASRPDISARPAGGTDFVGDGTYYPTAQVLTLPAGTSGSCAAVRIVNHGVRPDRMLVQADDAPNHWRVTWHAGARGVTVQVRGAGWSTGVLAPGASTRLCLRAVPRAGRHVPVVLRVRATSVLSGAVDRLQVKLR